MRRFIMIPMLCLLLCHCTMFADYVRTWTTNGKDGCKEWKTIQADGRGCRNFWRPCGRDYWSPVDNCGWEDNCNSSIIPSDALSEPFIRTPDYGIIVSVAPEMGGRYLPVSSPETCGGGFTTYSMWLFYPDGSSVVTMPPEMTRLQ